MALYGTLLLNANNQSNEHFRANSIAPSTRTYPIRYAVLLLFGIEKTEYRGEITQVYRQQKALKFKKLDYVELFLLFGLFHFFSKK